MPAWRPVPRIGRILDLVGLALLLSGTAVATRAWFGFRGLPDDLPAPGSSATSAIAVADGFWRLQKIGTGLMIAGVVVFVIAWWIAHGARERAPGDGSEARDRGA